MTGSIIKDLARPPSFVPFFHFYSLGKCRPKKKNGRTAIDFNGESKEAGDEGVGGDRSSKTINKERFIIKL